MSIKWIPLVLLPLLIATLPTVGCQQQPAPTATEHLLQDATPTETAKPTKQPTATQTPTATSSPTEVIPTATIETPSPHEEIKTTVTPLPEATPELREDAPQGIDFEGKWQPYEAAQNVRTYNDLKLIISVAEPYQKKYWWLPIRFTVKNEGNQRWSMKALGQSAMDVHVHDCHESVSLSEWWHHLRDTPELEKLRLEPNTSCTIAWNWRSWCRYDLARLSSGSVTISGLLTRQAGVDDEVQVDLETPMPGFQADAKRTPSPLEHRISALMETPEPVDVERYERMTVGLPEGALPFRESWNSYGVGRNLRAFISASQRKLRRGEPVVLKFTILNDGDEKETIEVDEGPIMDIMVLYPLISADIEERWSGFCEATPGEERLELRPGEFRTIEWTWTPWDIDYSTDILVIGLLDRKTAYSPLRTWICVMDGCLPECGLMEE